MTSNRQTSSKTQDLTPATHLLTELGSPFRGLGSPCPRAHWYMQSVFTDLRSTGIGGDQWQLAFAYRKARITARTTTKVNTKQMGVRTTKRMVLPNRQGMTSSASSDMKMSVLFGCLGRTHSAALSTDPLKSSRTMTRTRSQEATDAAAEATMDGMRCEFERDCPGDLTSSVYLKPSPQ